MSRKPRTPRGQTTLVGYSGRRRTVRTIVVTVLCTLFVVFVGLCVLGTVMPGTAAQPAKPPGIVKFSS